MRPGDIVEDNEHRGHYAVVKVSPDGDTLRLRDVITKVEYVDVPVEQVTLVPGLRERS